MTTKTTVRDLWIMCEQMIDEGLSHLPIHVITWLDNNNDSITIEDGKPSDYEGVALLTVPNPKVQE